MPLRKSLKEIKKGMNTMHTISYITVEKRSDIMKAAQEFAYYNVDRIENPSRSYHGGMTIHDTPVCESYQDAQGFIELRDKGFYDDHAVQYKDKGALKDTKQMTALLERISKQRKDREEYEKTHSVKTRKSTLAGRLRELR